MRKGFKKILLAATAAVMTVSALSLGACGYSLPHIEAPSAEDEVTSNGGFIVKKGDYLYFINGVEPSSSNNKYGTPVRGALMRVKQSDVEKGENNPEMVVPSLMVGDTGAGIYIYNDGKNDRIYYATPNTARDTESNTVDTSYLDFKSAKLDGTSIKSHFRLSSNTTTYRIVEENHVVYVLYVENSNLYSYNMNEGKLTTLVEGGSGYTLGGRDKTPEYVYYTKTVTKNADSDKGNVEYEYNQIYRVKASATEAPYEYEFDDDYIKNELGGKHPYVNLGELVLDGRASWHDETQFNHSDTTPTTKFGYTYTLRSRENDGVYFTRKQNTTVSDNVLYYLAEDDVAAENWDSVAGNDNLDVVASSANATDKATATALYYIDKTDGTHHYLYVENGSIYLANVDPDGDGETLGEDLEIAHSLSSPTLRFIDDKSDISDKKYKYVYYTATSGSGVSVSRAVYSGTASNYEDLPFGDNDNEDYKPVNVLDVKHSGSWYPFEIIDNILYFSDASTDVNSTAYNYINAVSLKSADNDVMNNREIAELNEKYDALMDDKDGVFAKITDISSDYNKLVKALRYYFFTGETTAFYGVIDEAVKEYGKSDVYLFSQEEQDIFKAFWEGKAYPAEDGEDDEEFFDDSTAEYRKRSYFVTFIGQMKDEHKKERDEYWYNYLEPYTPKTNADDDNAGLAPWKSALIGVAVCVVVLGAGAVVAFMLIKKKKKGEDKPKEEKLHVDTTDDRSVNVYEDEPAEEAEETPAEEPTEEPVEEPAEEPVPEESNPDSEE